jgi:rsbT co-antagonist protein RsbR
MELEQKSAALRYDRLFQTSSDLLCILGLDGKFISVNPAFRDVLGYVEDALVGREFKSILHADDVTTLTTFLEGPEDGFLRASLRFVHRDLSERRLALALRRITADGAIYGTAREVLHQDDGLAARRRADVLQKMEVTAQVGGWEIDLQAGTLFWTMETYRIHEVPAGFKPDVQTAINFYAPEAVPVITAAIEQAMKGIAFDLELQLITAKGRRIWVRASGHAVFEDGVVVRLVGAFQDIDAFKRREIELEEKLAIIEEQKSAIHAMSAPIIQVWDGVLALPVVGMLDESRASEITIRMLDAVVHQAANYAILDLTGVETVDDGTADYVLRIIRSIQLLGAQCIVTGIRPAVAQTLISLGAGFAGARTVSNLREAIKICMRGK